MLSNKIFWDDRSIEIGAKAIANVVTEHLNYSGYCKQNWILNLI